MLRYVGPDDSDKDRLALRKQQWGNLSDKAREQFYWAKAPRSPFDPEPEVPPPGGRDNETGKVLEPPPIFLLVLLEPTACDYLRLTDNFRQLDALEEDWVSTRVNP